MLLVPALTHKIQINRLKGDVLKKKKGKSKKFKLLLPCALGLIEFVI